MSKLNRLSLIAAAVGALVFAVPASAAVTSFSTILSSAGEPVPTSTATGAAVVSFDDLANTVTVLLSFSGLNIAPGATAGPFGHIHCCTATPSTGSAGVALNFTALPIAATGSYVAILSSGYTTGNSFASLLAGANAGRAYVNIHTPGTYGAGEIRGFLPAIPEPSTYAMFLAGLGLVGLMWRRRAARQA